MTNWRQQLDVVVLVTYAGATNWGTSLAHLRWVITMLLFRQSSSLFRGSLEHGAGVPPSGTSCQELPDPHGPRDANGMNRGAGHARGFVWWGRGTPDMVFFSFRSAAPESATYCVAFERGRLKW